MMAKKLLTLKEAAETLSCPVSTLRKLVWSGKLPIVTFPGGRKQYVRPEELERFIEQHEHTEGRN